MNRLLFGDNLGWLQDTKAFPDASVDLVYLDLPFNPNANYNVLFVKGGSVQESIQEIRTALKILGFGLDYRRYARFEKLTPVIIWGLRASSPLVRWYGMAPEVSDSTADLQFCIDFVIECALRLQELD